MRSPRQPIRALPIILPPLADELLSSWINRHAAFVGVSGGRLLRHYHIDVATVRDLDLGLSRRHAVLLADVLRCSPHLIRNMTQSRGSRVRSRLVGIRQPSQICRACAHRHAANVVTQGARLRNWMEGWRITCPICGAALEDFRPYTRLFRAGPADPMLARINGSAREGELIMDRAFRRRHGGSAHAALMRGLLFQQAPKTTTRATTAAPPRLLDLVVPGADDFFQRLPPENWPCTSRVMPLSVRIPVLAGVAAVSSRPEYWIDKLVGAAARQNQPELLRCTVALTSLDDVELSGPIPSRFRILPQNPESSGQRFRC
jgi:TniQ